MKIIVLLFCLFTLRCIAADELPSTFKGTSKVSRITRLEGTPFLCDVTYKKGKTSTTVPVVVYNLPSGSKFMYVQHSTAIRHANGSPVMLTSQTGRTFTGTFKSSNQYVYFGNTEVPVVYYQK